MNSKAALIRPGKDNEFVRTLERLINETSKTQTDMAEEIGYDNQNMITMFKAGTTRVPMKRVVPLAEAIDADPAAMLRLWFNTYMPEALSTIETVIGSFVLTGREKGWIKGLRAEFGDDMPVFSSRLLKVPAHCT